VKVQEYLKKVSQDAVIPSIQAYLIIGHGNTDPLIPYTESLRSPMQSRIKAESMELSSSSLPT
jgi:hypothetical protein